MNWLNVLFVYVLNMRCVEGLIEIEKAIFLENDFWCGDQKQPILDKGYLYGIDIKLERKNYHTNTFNYDLTTCFLLKSTNLRYIVVPRLWLMRQAINLFLKSPEDSEFCLRFHFFFNDKPNKKCFFNFERYDGKLQDYVTYKVPEKMSVNKNSIKLRCDVSIDTRLRSIKKRFIKLFLKMKLLDFDEYIKILNQKELKEKLNNIENDTIFRIYHYKNYLECFESLENFIKNLYYFKLIKDDEIKSSTEVSNEITNILKVSEFEEHLYKKFHDTLLTLYSNKTDKNWISLVYNYDKYLENKISKKIEEIIKTNIIQTDNFKLVQGKNLISYLIDDIWKPLFDVCCEFISNEMLKNNIFFPIRDKYDFNFYIEQLSNIIFESVKELQEESLIFICEGKTVDSSEMIKSLKFHLENYKIEIVKDFYESEYVQKHFFNLSKKEIITLDVCSDAENMICDYYNMFVYVFNLYGNFKEVSSGSYSYFSPISTDNFNLKIVHGIKIDFYCSEKFEKIRGFDDKGQEVVMVEDIDYFIDEFDSICCPLKVLEMKNINEIEVIFLNGKVKKKFKINEHLDYFI